MLEKSKIKGFIEDLEIEIDSITGTDRDSLEIRNLLSNAIDAGRLYDSYYTSTNARKFESAVEACEEKLGRSIRRAKKYQFEEDEDVDGLINEYNVTLQTVQSVYDEEKAKGRLTGLAKKEADGFYESCTKAIGKVLDVLSEYKANPTSKNGKKLSMAVEEYRKVADNYISFYNREEKSDKFKPKNIWDRIKKSALDMDPKKSLKNMGGCLRWAFYLFAAALVVDQFLTVGPALATFVSVGTTLGIGGCGIALLYNGGKFIINKAIKGKDYVVGRDPLAAKRKLANALEKNHGKGKEAKVEEKKVPRSVTNAAEKEAQSKKEKHDSFFVLLDDCLKGILTEVDGRIVISPERVRIARELLNKNGDYFVNADELKGNETVNKLSLIVTLYEKLNVIPKNARDIPDVMDQSVIIYCKELFDAFTKLDLSVNGRTLTENEKKALIGQDVILTMDIACPYKFAKIMDKIGAAGKCTESDFYEARNLYSVLDEKSNPKYAQRIAFYEKLAVLFELRDFLEQSEEDMKEMTISELKHWDEVGNEVLGYFIKKDGGEEFVRSVIPRTVSKFDKFNRVLAARGIGDERKPVREEPPRVEKPVEGAPRTEKPECVLIETDQPVGKNFIIIINVPETASHIAEIDDHCVSYNATQIRETDHTLYLAGTPLEVGDSTFKLSDNDGNIVARVVIHSKALERKPVSGNPFEGMHEPREPEPKPEESKPKEEKPAEDSKPKTKRKKTVRDTLPRVQADYTTFKSEQLAEVYRSALKEMEIAKDDMDSIEFRRGLAKALKIFDFASRNSLMAMFNAADVKRVKVFYDEYKTHVSGKIK